LDTLLRANTNISGYNDRQIKGNKKTKNVCFKLVKELFEKKGGKDGIYTNLGLAKGKRNANNSKGGEMRILAVIHVIVRVS
jgi:hypothetical protein